MSARKAKANAFAPIDIRFDDHASNYDLSLSELGLMACGITYANRNMSDGRIPAEWPGRRFGKEGVATLKKLLDKGKWRKREDWAGDSEIVGFLDHNPSKADILEKRANKAKAGKLGGEAKAAALAKALAIADAKAGAIAVATAVAVPSAVAHPLAPFSLSTDQDLSLPESSSKIATAEAGEADSGVRLRAAPEAATLTPCPDELPGQAMADLCAGAATAGWPDPYAEWPLFRAHRRANAVLRADYAEDFKLWLNRARGYAADARAKASRRPQDGPSDTTDPYYAPEAVRARERARDAKDREARANAVKPGMAPVGDVLAAIGAASGIKGSEGAK